MFDPLIRPDDGLTIPNPIGGRMIVKILDEDTNGGFSVHDNIIPAGSPGPLPHTHAAHDELFYVVDGVLTARIGDDILTAPAGSFVVIPRGTVHNPSNPSDTPVHVLVFFTPGGMDGFFREAAEQRIPMMAIPQDPAVRAAFDDFCRRYQTTFLGA